MNHVLSAEHTKQLRSIYQEHGAEGIYFGLSRIASEEGILFGLSKPAEKEKKVKNEMQISEAKKQCNDKHTIFQKSDVETINTGNTYYQPICSSKQTKKWRLNNICNTGGQRDSSCEKYQRNEVEKITGRKCHTSNGTRLNLRTHELRKKYRNSLTKDGESIEDGFDWTEDFDGYMNSEDGDEYFNLKFVCSGGGGQTRTLREVYHFIETQLKYLLKNKNKNSNCTFYNILDGDGAYLRRKNYKYLLNLPEYKSVNNYCFVGDMKTFSEYYRNKIKNTP